MQLHLSLPRFLRRPPRPAAAPSSVEGVESGQAGWHLSSFELRQGLDVTELDAGFLAGLEVWTACEDAPRPQA
ncbi:MAG TPA: hypothetical protein VFQ16_10045 [Burkholderiaceae bacterium]|nr:hypothetical protein [Burkholderiaceae bacterium]